MPSTTVLAILLAMPSASNAFTNPRSSKVLLPPPRALPDGESKESPGLARRDVLSTSVRFAAASIGLSSGSFVEKGDAATFQGEVFSSPLEARAYVVTSYRTPSISKWRKSAVESNMKDKKFVFPPEMKVVRQIFAKSSNQDGTSTVHGVTVFTADALTAVQNFFDEDQNVFWAQGRAQGWLDGPLHVNFAKSALYRGIDEGPPATMKRGSGFAFSACGLGRYSSYSQWEDIYKKSPLAHGCTKAVAGPLIKPGSTDLRMSNSVGVYQAFTKVTFECTNDGRAVSAHYCCVL